MEHADDLLAALAAPLVAHVAGAHPAVTCLNGAYSAATYMRWREVPAVGAVAAGANVAVAYAFATMRLTAATAAAGLAGALAAVAVERGVRRWRKLHMGRHERMVLMQVATSAGGAWLAHAVSGAAPDPNDEDAMLAAIRVTLMGGAALCALLLLPAFVVFGRRNDRCIRDSAPTGIDAAVDDGVAKPAAPGRRRAGTGGSSSSSGSDEDDGGAAAVAGGHSRGSWWQSPATRAWAPTAAFAAVCGTIIAGCEYPYLWRVLQVEPFTWVVAFMLQDARRLGLVLWWAAVVVALVMFVPSHHDVMEGGGAKPPPAGAAAASAQPPSPAAVSPPPTQPPPAAAVVAARGFRGHFTRHRVNLLLRKVFHVAAFTMFAPPAVWCASTRAMLGLALVVAAKVLLVLECARALHIKPSAVSSSIHAYMTTYTDDRDKGVFVLTHVYLLLGCAVPLWLWQAAPPAAGTAGTGAALSALWPTVPLAGTLALGIGDAFAAIGGICAAAAHVSHTWGGVAGSLQTLLGSFTAATAPRHWPGATKTVEGTASFVIAVAIAATLTGAAVVALHGTPLPTATQAGLFLAAVAAAALLETFTAAIDNVLVPAYLWVALQACVS